MSLRGLSKRVEDALFHCGPDRIFHNDGTTPGVAIRWLPPPVPPEEERWIAELGPTRDEAGERAARRFAEKLRYVGTNLIAWAERIERALEAKPPSG